MAPWCFLLLATYITVAVGVSVHENPIAFKRATWKKCGEQENVPEDAMQEVYFFRSVEAVKDHKCVLKCIDEDYGIYLNDGTMDKVVLVETIKRYWKDKHNQEKLTKKGVECVDTADTNVDPCQYNYDVFDCYIQYLTQEGIPIDPE